MHLKGAFFKLNLSKAYDRAEWVYLCLLQTHVGFCLEFINCFRSCIKTTYFTVLINGAAYPLFHAQTCLQRGFPISPLLFILRREGLSQLLEEEKPNGPFYGCLISHSLEISHLLLVDAILIFCNGDPGEVAILKNILDLFEKAFGMLINYQISSLIVDNLEINIVQSIRVL